MYEDLLSALQYVLSCRKEPFIQMFSVEKMAGDCAGAISRMNEALEQITAERDRYREDSIVLSLMVLSGGGRKPADPSHRLPFAAGRERNPSGL